MLHTYIYIAHEVIRQSFIEVGELGWNYHTSLQNHGWKQSRWPELQRQAPKPSRKPMHTLPIIQIQIALAPMPQYRIQCKYATSRWSVVRG